MAIIAIRTVVIYVFIILGMRIMGKRQLGEMQPAELVVTLLISDLAAVPMQESGMPLLNGIIPILILISLELLLSGLMLKLPVFQRLIGGRPKIIVRDGRVDGRALRDMRMTVEDMMESLRQQGVFDLREVQYAIVESTGKVSVLLKPGNRPATCNDMQVRAVDIGMPMIVISDGTVSRWGMDVCALDDRWLEDVLRKNGVTADDVFLMTADKSRAYTLMLKSEAAAVARAGRGGEAK